MDDELFPPPRKKRVDREHILQTHIRRFVRDAVGCEHVFLAFDRAKAAGGVFTRQREKARGIRNGTPDTVLRVASVSAIWVELKSGTNKPSDEQNALGKELQALGDIWAWTNSVAGYCDILRRHGVPLRVHADLIAEDRDLRVASDIAKEENKAPSKGKVREMKPSRGKIRAYEAVRARTRY